MRTAARAGQEQRLEILVQDDASPDLDLTEIVGPPASVARNETNLGFAGNCNAGAARAHGDILLFLNQDTVARPGWFEPLMAAFDNQAVGVVGPKLVFADPAGGKALTQRRKDAKEEQKQEQKEDLIQSCGGLYGGNRGPFHRWIGWRSDDWRVNVPERVSWTTGAALAIRRELFVAAGGFDPGYVKGYFEDVDLCERAKSLGAQVWYEPRAVFEHRVGSTGGVPAEVFRANSRRFHARWDAVIVPDTQVVMVDY